MSAAEQLELGGIGTPKRHKSRQTIAREEMCTCGCELAGHAGEKHGGACSRCGQCKRGRPMKKRAVEIPLHLCPPNGSIPLERETEKQKLVRNFGWALVEDGALTFYLSQLRTKSPNEFQAPQRNTRFRNMAIDAGYKETCRERAMCAIIDAGVVSWGRPSSIAITRVSQGLMDRHDNLRGALKYVVDGVALALLGEDDSDLEDARVDAIRADLEDACSIEYSQEKPGKRGVRGVRLVIKWSSL